MILSDLSVKRPVFATVINLLIITFGIVAFLMLPLREYPDIDPPIVNISTNYPGASAAIVQIKSPSYLKTELVVLKALRPLTQTVGLAAQVLPLSLI